MALTTQESNKIIGLPTLSEFGNDVLHVIGATPIALSPNGVELLVAMNVNSSTSGQKTEYLLYNMQTETYTRNLSAEVGLGDSSTVNITAIDAIWYAGNIVVTAAYEDLLSSSFLAGYSNRVGLLKADGSFLSDVVEATTGEVANGAVTALRLDAAGNRVAIQTSASNLLADASDANDSSDVYLLDIIQSSATRKSVLTDGTELSSGANLIGIFESANGQLSIAFETLGTEFAADDANARNDIYVSNSGSIALVSKDLSETAQGATAKNTLLDNGKIYYVSRSGNITDDDYDSQDDIFAYNNGANLRVSTALDHLSVGIGFEVALVSIISDTELVISVKDATLNGVEVSGQLLGLNTQSNTLTLLSVTADGNPGDDVSLGYLFAEYNKEAYIYQTYATNIANYEVPAMVTNIAFSPYDAIIGTTGDDILQGTANVDEISTGLGADTVSALAGNDTITLTADSIWSAGYAAKNVSNISSVGTKEMIALDGLNRFSDVIDGGDDIDTLNLTAGNDAFFIDDVYSAHHSSLTLSSTTQGIDSIARVVNLEVINAGAGNDIVDLTSVNFILTNAVEINGEAGNDILWGSNGNDTVNGGEGDDTIFGGSGNDTLTGNSGSDIFQFTATAANDIITDFSLTDDSIQLYYRAEDNHTNTNLSFASGVLTWDVDSISNDIVVIDLSVATTSSNFSDIDQLINFVEIVQLFHLSTYFSGGNFRCGSYY